jgi:hypothetical protein
MQRRILSIPVGIAFTAVVVLTASVYVALAASGHFITNGAGAVTCTDIGTQVACGGKVAGLGGTTFEIRVEAPGTAIVTCENPGGKDPVPGQNTDITAAGSSGPLPTPRNGQYEFGIMTDPPVVPNFPTCPNDGWSAHVVDVVFGDATLSLFEDGVLVDQVIVPVTVPAE